jgi:hypothetical protein
MITRNSTGNAKVKKAAAGLRQNEICSNRAWRRASRAPLIGVADAVRTPRDRATTRPAARPRR